MLDFEQKKLHDKIDKTLSWIIVFVVLCLFHWSENKPEKVRDSESTPGDFSLSVKMNGGVDHYRVLRDTCKSLTLFLSFF